MSTESGGPSPTGCRFSVYELPALGKRMGLKPLGWVVDNWQVNGITSFISGSPYTPTFRMADNADLTGSAMGPRIIVTGDPNLSKSEKTFERTFNTAMFAPAPKGTWGNAGNGILRGPGVNNWDVALSKRFPLWSEASNLTFRSEFFNAWFGAAAPLRIPYRAKGGASPRR